MQLPWINPLLTGGALTCLVHPYKQGALVRWNEFGRSQPHRCAPLLFFCQQRLSVPCLHTQSGMRKPH